MPVRDPKNPYVSCLVRASAGSGKTYQLSQRFLCLVASGADPGHILTITFTVKAAGEMRERILSEAARLTRDVNAQQDFDAMMQSFFRASGQGCARPRPAVETGALILQATQLVRITTIDAVFLDWVRKFPWEASGAVGVAPQVVMPSPFTLIDRTTLGRINERAFFLALSQKPESVSGSVLEALDRMDLLHRHHTFLWQLDRSGEQGIRQHPVGSMTSTVAEVWQNASDDLAQLAAVMTLEKRGEFLAAAKAVDLEQLMALGFLRKDGLLAKTSFRSKAAKELTYLLDAFNDRLIALHDNAKINALNTYATGIKGVYLDYARERDRLKYRRGFIEFNDAAKGSFNVFHSQDAAGARYLIHRRIQHLMLDEFQDTSWLQWQVFGEICEELMAGSGLTSSAGTPGTVFLVGDEKQSIYGFREADPAIMAAAEERLVPQGAIQAALSESYRSAPTLMRFLTAAFSERMTSFPEHRTATAANGLSVCPDICRITIAPVCLEDGHTEEAEFIAGYLEGALGEAALVVHDKEFKKARRLKASDCVILYRAATHAGALEAALQARGIRTRREEGHGFFDIPEVKDCLSLLRHVAYPDDALALASLLKSPLFNLNDTPLLQGMVKTKSEGSTRLDGGALRLWLKTYDNERALALDELHRAAAVMDVPGFILHACHTLNAFKAFSDRYGAAHGHQIEANIALLCDLALSLGTAHIRGPAAMLQHIEGESLNEDIGNAPSGDDAVTLMTIHKSKGLEFPLVVLTNTAKHWDNKDRYWVKAANPSAPGVFYCATQSEQPLNDAHFNKLKAEAQVALSEENYRLLYVALTRARHHLVVTGYAHRYDDSTALAQLTAAAESLGGREQLICSKLCMVLEGETRPMILADEADVAAPLSHHSVPTPTRLRAPAEIKTVAPHRLLLQMDAKHRDSSSAQGRFEVAHGTFVHRALEAKAKAVFFDHDLEWRRLMRGIVMADHQIAYQQAVIEVGAVTLHPNWLSLFASATAFATEQEVVGLDGHTLIHGSIDLVIESSSEILVVDYKTTADAVGLSAPELYALSRSKGYDRQLKAYAHCLKPLYQPRSIQTAVYFTKINTLLRLSQTKAEGSIGVAQVSLPQYVQGALGLK